MGGSYYERAIETTSSTTGASAASEAAMSQSSVHTDCRVFSSADQRMVVSSGAQPIIICFDVTGSMGEWPRVIYDKIPMLYGQIMSNGYVDDPQFAFMAVGDRNATLQCSNFASGNEIDSELKKIFIAGQGRGKVEEYEYAPCFINNNMDFSSAAIKPFFFLIGDAEYTRNISPADIGRIFGASAQPEGKDNIDCKVLWKQAMEKVDVYYLHKFFWKDNYDRNSLDLWRDTLGAERVMLLDNAKACADAILGVLAIASGERDLESYMEDMVTRGQDEQRCAIVRNALECCANALSQSRAGYKNEGEKCQEDDLA